MRLVYTLLNGKSDNFTQEDFLALAKLINLKHPQEEIKRVANAVKKWAAFAKKAGVPDEQSVKISKGQRTELVDEVLSNDPGFSQ